VATGLRRTIGLGGVVATSSGLGFAALSYLAAATLVTHVAGDSAWVALAVAGLLMLINWGFFGELNGLFPTAAAMRLWMGKSMDDRIALTITFTYVSTIGLVIAADAYIIGSAITYALGQAKWVAALWIGAVLAIATYANLKGIRVAASVQAVATTVVITATVTVFLIALARGGFDLHTPANPLHDRSVGDFVQAVAIGIFLYSAFEWVTTNAEEVSSPALIPRGMLITLGILFVTCSVIATGMSNLLTDRQLDSAHPQLFVGRHAAGQAGLIVMMVVTGLTAVNTFNGGFVTASRFVYATAREGNLPQAFTRLNDRAVPWVPVLVLAAGSLTAAVAVALTGAWEVIVAIGATLEAMIYAVAGFCVLRLRRRLPDAERPFRFRGGRPLAIGAICLFGLLGAVASVTVGTSTNPAPLAIVLTIACGSALYVLLFVPKLRAAELARREESLARRRQRRLEARGSSAET
jgi:basic amino acid/polyamine antiporter, APA family